MKTIQFFTTILLFVVFTSCNNDDDNSTQPTLPINWSLTHVAGGFAGIDDTFPTGLIQWAFDQETNTLIVVNNNDDDMLNDMFDSGSYPYNIENNGTDDILTVDGIELGVITQSENEINIDQQPTDGFLLTLTR